MDNFSLSFLKLVCLGGGGHSQRSSYQFLYRNQSHMFIQTHTYNIQCQTRLADLYKNSKISLVKRPAKQITLLHFLQNLPFDNLNSVRILKTTKLLSQLLQWLHICCILYSSLHFVINFGTFHRLTFIVNSSLVFDHVR